MNQPIERKRIGRPPYIYEGEQLLSDTISFRATQSELTKVEQHAERLKVSRTDVLRGMIHSLPDDSDIQEGITVYVRKVPVLLSRRDAKQLLQELTSKLLE